MEEQVATPVGEQQVLEQEADDGPTCMDSNTFKKMFTLKLENEWDVDGTSPEWGPSMNGRPLEWGEELRSMKLAENDREGLDDFYEGDQMAVSPDGRFMALATGTIIRVYDMAEKEVRAELVGHLGSVSSLMFVPKISSNHYTLLSQGATEPGRYTQNHTIVTWHLDSQGTALNTTAPFSVEILARKALNAVWQDLTDNHNLSVEAFDDLHTGFVNTFKTADTKNRQQALKSFPGTFPSFGSKPLSHDGSRVLYVLHNETSQNGMRPEESMPQILIRSLETPSADPIATLTGYKDAIMWASFSPTNPNIIASACWDGTYRIWDISTVPATCSHTIKIKKSPQNWSGDFSPDGKYVLLSGTDNVAVYSVATGEEISSLSSKRKLESWVRSISWNPVDNSIALVSGAEILLWEPFDGDKVSPVVTLSKGGINERWTMALFMEFRTVKWLNGDTLAAKAAEDSWLVWDRRRGLKWRFVRPKGIEEDSYTADCALVEGGEGKRVFVSLDGDRKVREWLLE